MTLAGEKLDATTHVLQDEVYRPRPRPFLRFIAAFLLVAGALGGYFALQRDTYVPPALLSHVPDGADAFGWVDWRRVSGDKGFRRFLKSMEADVLSAPAVERVYRKLRLEHGQLDSAVLATYGLMGARELLLVVRGLLDVAAVEGVLLAELGLSARQLGACTLFTSDRRPAFAAGWLGRELFVAGARHAVERAMDLMNGKGRSLASHPDLRALLARVQGPTMVLGAAELGEALHARVSHRLGGAARPQRVALSLDDSEGTLTAKAALGFGERAEKNLASWQAWTHATANSLEKEFVEVPQLAQLGAALALEARWTDDGPALLATSRVAMEKLGLLEVVTSFAVPPLRRYQREQAVRAELVNLVQIADRAIAWFKAHHADDSGEEAPASARLPASVGPTPGGDSCRVPGREFPPSPARWTHPTWKALGFAPAVPQVLSYSFEVTFREAGPTFTVRASGDPTCEGTPETFEITGRTNARGELERSGIEKGKRSRPAL